MYPPKYSKDQLGHVSINGSVTLSVAPAQNQTIATLPVGYRPSRTAMILLTQGNGWNTIGYIYTTGEVKIYNGPVPDGYIPANVMAIIGSFLSG